MRGGVLLGILVLAAPGRASAQAAPTDPEVVGAQAAPAEPEEADAEVAAEAPPVTSVALDEPGRTADVGCPVRDSRRTAGAVYVVCEDGRLLWVDTTEGVVETVEVHGRAVALFEHGGRVWVEVVRREAVALDPPGEAPSDAGDAALAIRTPVDPTQSAPPVAGPAPWWPVPASVPARSSVAPPEEPEAPPRHGPEEEEWPTRVVGTEVRGTIRPFVGAEGGGLVADAGLTYRFELPLFVDVEVDPVGVGVGRPEDMGVFGGSVLFGYDHGAFQIGVGVGLWHVDIQEFDRFATGLGTAFRQSVRLGSRDGTHIGATNTFVLVDGEMFFGGLEGGLQVRLSDRSWLLFRGGGGITGYGYGELAARLLVSGGEGGRGLFVVPGFGAVAVFREFDSLSGPSVLFGIEWRP